MCDQSRPSTSALSRGAVGSLAAPARFRNRRDGQRTSELLASSATDMGEVLRALSERTFPGYISYDGSASAGSETPTFTSRSSNLGCALICHRHLKGL